MVNKVALLHGDKKPPPARSPQGDEAIQVILNLFGFTDLRFRISGHKDITRDS
jgi:hypothetical protein